MTETDLIEWLVAWTEKATQTTVDKAQAPDVPLEQLGLSSRDVIILSGELENLLGVKLDPTVAYQYPTIRELANGLISAQTQGTSLDDDAMRTPHRDAHRGHDVAIIGRAGRFPQADNPEEYWKLLVEGRCVTGSLPEGRWSTYAGDEVMMNKIRDLNVQGGYLDDITSFDNEFFGLSPLEAANMDPQQRIMLELAWEALEDAHIPPSSLRGESVGVFVGSSSNDYGLIVAADPAEAHAYALTGTSSSIIPNRISYAFDFRGPSMNVDTACSSSLVSVHHAVRALRDGEADVALAGGVNILASPFISTAFAELGVISPTGKIHAFSDDADGFVRSEGAGFIVLKRLEDAEADGDEILGVIKGSATNSDGHSNGLTAPNPDAQVDVLRRAYADAGVDPSTVDLVEAHGTGTVLGDPIEASALSTVLGEGRSDAEPLLLGSAKSNIGHTESAAGVAALIKVIEALGHDTVPPTANFTEGNRFIDFSTIEVVEDPREWPQYSGRRVAGVSGFGFGGTNAHVVLTDYVGAHEATRFIDPDNPNRVALPVSGLLPSRRKESAAQIAQWLESTKHSDSDLPAIARSLATRNHGRSAAVVTADTIEAAVKGLSSVAEGKTTTGVVSQDAPSTMGPVFVYSGFGSQHRKMAKRLVEIYPPFKKRIEELDKVVGVESGWSMLDIILDDEKTYDTETGQVTITAIQIALTDLMASFGIRPAATMGMSMGEMGAAYASGGLSAEDAIIIACARARLMGEGEQVLAGTDGEGAMAVVELSREELTEFIAEHPEATGVEPAVYAGPGMTTVGGPGKAVDFLVDKLEGEKFARKLGVRGAGHTSMLDPILGELAAEIAGITPKPLHTPLFSSVHRGKTYGVGAVVHDVEYFTYMTNHPVYFQDATEAAFAAGHTTFVEISPNPVALMGMMNTAFSVGKPDAQLLFSLKRKEEEVETLSDLAAKLYVQGMPVDFAAMLGSGPRIDVPKTAFKKTPFWTTARPSSGSASSGRVSLPDGSVAYSASADSVFSALQLVEQAAADLIGTDAASASAQVVEHATLPASGEITTIASTNPAGVAVKIYSGASLLAEGFAGSAATARVSVAPAAAVPAPAPESPSTTSGVAPASASTATWTPGTPVAEHLRFIVSESMGYDAEDLPDELPLIDLGLDSLMGMRIKNRVENDFQIPPLDLQALRDASVADVIALVEDAVASVPRVAPRDASERMVFGAWSKYTGAAPAGVTSHLPGITDEQAANIAGHLTERSGIGITADNVKGATALEQLADLVREGLETPVEGNVRVLRPRQDTDRTGDGSQPPAVFLFHPAGGSNVVYEPLTRRLPQDVPVYGLERLEGSLQDRVKEYLPDIIELADGGPIVLGGWSFGGALAYEVAHQLQQLRAGADGDSVIPEVKFIALLDTTRPRNPTPDTPENVKARWERYAAFAKETYDLDVEVPYEMLETQGEDALIEMLTSYLAAAGGSDNGLAAGVLEHQRASFVDNQILAKVDMQRWAAVDKPVLLFRSERMHDGAIMLEPAYADIAEDGGWAKIVDDLEIVHLPGDHLAVVDEPAIGIVGEKMTEWLNGDRDVKE
ncbi:type I polyketide synthase [Corynebacterium aquatimens]|uniref:Polyketide synthase 13 n=1 Tax=Corynebacterium aquatimens TaxID=1190508 RepID=A0A931E5L9_9CORY|nr:type I polyketide synthase [Corynebacterium aquatimens]MBG6122853.1 polyketide synthase 13 [Corynebacterium aquatimens]WJY66812.1 Phthiocerol/phenolphthiocerol synthesis polyketide synthase type I PpsA [Corynebacterium aquatimens]